MIAPELVKAALLHYAEEVDGWGSFSAYLNYYDAVGQEWQIPGLGTVEVIAAHNYDSDKNYSGWSEDIWVVFDVQGMLYKATGTYTSYTGGGWDDELKIVRPAIKQITVYEEVND